eukprot:TRINITY_DN26253_c0_g1_i1.p1 TRINITY_DN26253_c0_g1~~TRINITY_DN26253_c0_g1_i1.p1  ORF type:complete len:332 (+),score=58.71 TRINITY_DN26253_c0_g1_i1:122-1117(+)
MAATFCCPCSVASATASLAQSHADLRNPSCSAEPCQFPRLFRSSPLRLASPISISLVSPSRFRKGVCASSNLSNDSFPSPTVSSINPIMSVMGASHMTENFSVFSQAQQMQRGSADGDVMGLLLRQRIVFLGHQLDDYVADAIVSQLLLLDAQNPNKDIRLFVNCPGGSMSAAMAIFDAIQLCRADISTICFGLAASTATLVLAGGTRGKRLAMPNARIMMHQPLGGASGQAIDVEIQAKEIMHHKTNVTTILAQITNKTYAQVEKDIDRDRYMSPSEAMEYGILDGVIDKDSIIPLLPIPDKVKSRPEHLESATDARSFLTPKIPDDEIF